MCAWFRRKNAPPPLDEDGRSLAWHAAFEGDPESVRAAVACGACPSSGDALAGTTPLQIAALKGHVATVAALLELGADPNTCDQHGNTALWTAVVSAPNALRAQIAEQLLDAGAQPDAPNRAGRTPRELAMEIAHGLERVFESRV